MRIAVETVFSLLTLAEVGSSLDDERPTLVLAVGGGELRFVNAAAASFLGIPALDPAFGTVPALAPAILRQTLRFAERAAAGASGLELLRVPNGLRTAVVGCRMTHLGAPAGEPVVLLRLEGVVARAAAHDIAASLALLAAEDRLLAAFDAEGEVLAASGDYALLEGSQDEIEDFVVAAADSPLARKSVRRGEALSEALVVRIGGERELRLIAIEPVEHAPAEAPAVPVAVAAPAPAPIAAEPDHMLDPIFFALSPLPTPDDYAAWQADARREAARAPDAAEIDAEVAALAAELGGAPEATDATPMAEIDAADTAPAALATGSDGAADAETAPGEPAVDQGAPEAADAIGTSDIPGAEPAVVPEDGAAGSPIPVASAEDLRRAVELVTGAAADEPTSETAAASQTEERPSEASAGAPPEADSPADAGPTTPVAEPAGSVASDFVFAPDPRPRRFVWQMDADERFTFVSEDFRAAVGPRAADLVGATWSELRARLGVDRDGIVAAALARRDTWSGLTALWPVEGEALRIPVDLAALPAFGRRREFEGYRGFGVCRTVEAVPDPSGTGLRILLEDLVPEPPDGGTPTGSAPDGASPDDRATEAEALGAAEPAAVPPVSTSGLEATDTASSAAPADTIVPTAPAAAEPGWPDAQSAMLPDAETRATDAPDETEAPLASGSEASPAEPDAAFAGEIDRPDDVTGTPVDVTAAPLTETVASPPDLGPTEPTHSEVPAPAAAPAPARPDQPGGSRVVTVPANRGSRIVTLPTAHRAAPDRNRLSGPERIAFRQIAAALGARIEGEDGHPTGRAAEPPADDTPSEEDRPAPVAAQEAGSETAGRAAEARSAGADDVAATALTAEVTLGESSDSGSVASLEPARVEDLQSDATLGLDRPDLVGPDPTPASTAEAAALPIVSSSRPGPALPGPVVDGPLVLAEPTAATAEADRAGSTSEAEPAAAEDEIVTVMRILDRLPVGCAVLKDDGLAHVNEAFLTMLGYPDRAAFEAAGGLDAIFAGEHVGRRFVEEGQVRPLPVISRTGAVVPVAARMAGIPWGAGSAILLTLDRMPRQSIEPVTETVSGRAALDALGEARERANELEAVVDTATDGVLMLDVDGRVISANRAAEALFGMERAEMAARPLVDLLAPESRRSAQDYLDGLARNGVASVLNDGREVIGQVPPDGLIPLFMTIGRISSGSGSKFCAVLRDITQWKKSEEELTGARRRAEEASSHKSEFLAKISHEIRTPLNAIIGFSEVMLDERFGPIGSDRYKDYLRDIHTSGSHIMSLINDLLDLSKVEAGKMELKFEAVSLADIAGECVALMQPQANRERIIIRTSLPSGVPAVVADGRSIRQIILNLLSNAVKFTPAGGQVIVSTALEDTGEVVVRVRDTGFGMSEKEIQAALEPFRQLHTTRVRSGGTGLGLPLTKALVEANRATFRIDSVVNQGTLVSITFPVTRVLAG